MKKFLYTKFYPLWKSTFATGLKAKRLSYIDGILDGKLFDQSWLEGRKILEVGCANGKDFMQFFKNYEGVSLTGLDINNQNIEQKNCSFLQIDAQQIPFGDKYFDLCVSFGVLEHIQPIEKLCKVISEIERVAKSYVILVPAISTIFEPHTTEFFWQLKPAGRKRESSSLNYFSDEAWLQFEGFRDAHIKRYSYIPFLIRNTIIYKVGSEVRVVGQLGL